MNGPATVTGFDVPTETRGETAVAYALLGWRVFPIVPGGKVPQFRRAHGSDDAQRACPGGQVCGRLGHGFKDAVSDPARVARWWARNPACNIGIATGSPAGPGTSSPDVLDIDVKGDAPGLATLDRLRRVGLTGGAFAMASTPSGGWHLFFDGTGQSSATLKRHGVDFRSCGGYVVAPGSVVSTRIADTSPDGTSRRVRRDERPYRWVPERFNLGADGTVDWYAIREFLAPSPPPRDLMYADVVADSANPLVQWFAEQPTGSRNNALYWAACRILESGYPTSALEDLRVEAVRSGLPDGEVRKTIGSAVRRIAGGL